MDNNSEKLATEFIGKLRTRDIYKADDATGFRDLRVPIK